MDNLKLLFYTVKDNVFLKDIRVPFVNQVHFLTYAGEELLYGGQAGGGKSDALLMGALQYVEEKHIPEDENRLTYDCLILRRTLDDLEMPNAILDRAKQWLLPFEDMGLVYYRDIKKQFRFSSGATITFRYLAHNNDLNKYQGAEFQYVAFDELTQFLENQYNYLHSRLRKTEDNPIPLRMRAGSNPGGVGHDWVKKKFVDEDSPVPFISSAFSDNPYLDQVEYSKQLDKLDPLTRQQLKFGDWDAVITEGLLLNRGQFNQSLVSLDYFTDWSPVYCVIGIDPASTGSDRFAMACIVMFEKEKSRKACLVDLDSTQSSSPEECLKNFIIRNGCWKPSVVNFEREPGSDSRYALNYWNTVLMPLCREYHMYVKDTPASSTGSKYSRARPHANLIKEGLFFINSLIGAGIPGNMHNPLNALGNQYIYVHPDRDVMKQYSSPDELDSVSYAFSEVSHLFNFLK